MTVVYFIPEERGLIPLSPFNTVVAIIRRESDPEGAPYGFVPDHDHQPATISNPLSVGAKYSWPPLL